MTRKVALVSLTIALSILAIGRPVGAKALVAPARVYVSVTDNKNKPLAGLTAADFKIAIDDKEQEVLSVEPATEPVDAVIITDRLGLDPAYSNFTVQHALSGFVKGIRSVPDSRIALTTFDGPVVRITGFNAPATDLNKAIGRLSTNATEGGMLNAIVDACELLRDSKTDRKVIFAMFAAYRADTSNQWNDKAVMTMWQSGASLWALEVQSIGGASGGNAGREEVASLGSRMSGVMRVSVASAVGLSNQAELMASLIAKQ
ncbi:MAG TPA: hypothetical protein VMZ90_05025 [Vicinamibacterales bacterium]|nr:hypothetical protein [Vicinamibacterales bacterium]